MSPAPSGSKESAGFRSPSSNEASLSTLMTSAGPLGFFSSAVWLDMRMDSAYLECQLGSSVMAEWSLLAWVAPWLG